jgi:hypothetical protein
LLPSISLFLCVITDVRSFQGGEAGGVFGGSFSGSLQQQQRFQPHTQVLQVCHIDKPQAYIIAKLTESTITKLGYSFSQEHTVPMASQGFCGGGGGGAAGGGAPRQRVRARRGQATDPHSIAERVSHHAYAVALLVSS